MSDVPRLHVVTPVPFTASVMETTRCVLAAGAPLVQVRMKDVPDRLRWRHAVDVVVEARAARARCVCNDRVDLALAVGADGVHLGEDDLPVEVARRLLPRGLVGATARDPQAARRAQGAGADYLGVGPVYAPRRRRGSRMRWARAGWRQSLGW